MSLLAHKTQPNFDVSCQSEINILSSSNVFYSPKAVPSDRKPLLLVFLFIIVYIVIHLFPELDVWDDECRCVASYRPMF